jgi:DNA-binding transcriptional LysR family regulator
LVSAVDRGDCAARSCNGELVRVLPEWSFPEVTGWAVFPGRRLMPAKTRVFIDMLEAAFDSSVQTGM